ncbi:MAG: hypothetical protein QG625_3804 [Cyanobacteriota bacterium erpe_2018_sw_39hr_WHONDRS-SW48-000098_B_bin.30]|nr:hypothetical protein [Cyanobacteriota bacterium erpe_2018_sw_39hr_WHONDRS-SW48-000098_B_bin.30]
MTLFAERMDRMLTKQIDQALFGSIDGASGDLNTLNIQQPINQINHLHLENIILIEQFQQFNQIPSKETGQGFRILWSIKLSATECGARDTE